MSPQVTAGPPPLRRWIGFALLGAILFAVVHFHLSSHFILLWIPVAILLLAGKLAVAVGRLWALNRRHLNLARWLTFDAPTRAWIDVQIAITEGNLAEARRLFDQLPRTTIGDVYAWNLYINALITGGLYREALRARRTMTGRLRAARSKLREHYGLALLNCAEALYNLGRWRRARQLMERLDSGGYLEVPLNRAGGHAQLAWIDAHDGNSKAALERLAKVELSALPYDYRAEFHFTVAAAHLAARDVPKARAALAAARKVLVRPSSERNLLFLEARCDHAEGKLREAAMQCERAARHAYQGQGGDGLLFWGDVCEQLGDPAGARQAWELATSRDPESESAALAKARLTANRRESA